MLDTGLVGSPSLQGWQGSDKQEGVAVLNNCAVALGSDNDFGLLDNQSSFSVVHLATCLKTLYAGM